MASVGPYFSAKKVLRRTNSDSLVVVELNDSDPSSFLEVDIVSPAELEEVEEYLVESESEIDDIDSDPDSDSDSGISSRFSRLNCDEQQEESDMTQNRLQRRLSKRTSLRVFKRPHSQTANSDNGATDTDDADERGDASIRRRRLRRRMLSPVAGPVDWEDGRSSPKPAGLDDVLASVKQESGQDRKVQRTYASVLKGDDDDRTVESQCVA